MVITACGLVKKGIAAAKRNYAIAIALYRERGRVSTIESETELTEGDKNPIM